MKCEMTAGSLRIMESQLNIADDSLKKKKLVWPVKMLYGILEKKLTENNSNLENTEMHPVYLQDYIARVRRDLQNDMEFLGQGLHTTYQRTSKRTSDAVYHAMNKVSWASNDLKQALKELDALLEKINSQKDDKQDAT